MDCSNRRCATTAPPFACRDFPNCTNRPAATAGSGDHVFVLNPDGAMLDAEPYTLILGNASAEVYLIATATCHVDRIEKRDRSEPTRTTRARGITRRADYGRRASTSGRDRSSAAPVPGSCRTYWSVGARRGEISPAAPRGRHSRGAAGFQSNWGHQDAPANAVQHDYGGRFPAAASALRVACAPRHGTHSPYAGDDVATGSSKCSSSASRRFAIRFRACFALAGYLHAPRTGDVPLAVTPDIRLGQIFGYLLRHPPRHRSVSLHHRFPTLAADSIDTSITGTDHTRNDNGASSS